MLIGAHRGAYKDESLDENSISAFKKAIDFKCDYVEFDVHKTIDGKYVIFHNNDININNEKLAIKNCSWDDFLDKYRLPITNEPLPLLEEVVNVCKGKIRLNIEIKDPTIGAEVVEHVLSFGLPKKDFFVSSFHESVMQEILSSFPDVYTGFLFLGNYWSLSNPKKAISFNCKAINPYYRFLTKKVRKFAKQNNLEIHVWTVNDKKIEKFLKESITSIITNDVLLALDLRDKISLNQ